MRHIRRRAPVPLREHAQPQEAVGQGMHPGDGPRRHHSLLLLPRPPTAQHPGGGGGDGPGLPGRPGQLPAVYHRAHQPGALPLVQVEQSDALPVYD